MHVASVSSFSEFQTTNGLPHGTPSKRVKSTAIGHRPQALTAPPQVALAVAYTLAVWKVGDVTEVNHVLTVSRARTSTMLLLIEMSWLAMWLESTPLSSR